MVTTVVASPVMAEMMTATAVVTVTAVVTSFTSAAHLIYDLS
jgi:hypothetical protein